MSGILCPIGLHIISSGPIFPHQAVSIYLSPLVPVTSFNKAGSTSALLVIGLTAVG